MEIGKFYHIELKNRAKEFYSRYPANGWYGVVTDINDEHIYIKYFDTVYPTSEIVFGFMSRIVLYDIADYNLLYSEEKFSEQ